MTALLFLFLVSYPACGDALIDLSAGPFATMEACEKYKESVLRMRGPPPPGSFYQCRTKS